MPWTTDNNGEKRYILSKYCKEELPTWFEITDLLYDERMPSYRLAYFSDDKDHVRPDPYWKYPKRLVLLATVCNQFNKMIFEDGFMEPLLEFINGFYVLSKLKVIDVRFYIAAYDVIATGTDEVSNNVSPDVYKDRWEYLTECISESEDGTIIRKFPVIYNFPLPTGEPNIFETFKDVCRFSAPDLINCESIDKNFIRRVAQLTGQISFKCEDECIRRIHVRPSTICLEDSVEDDDTAFNTNPFRFTFNNILQFIMRPIDEYFRDEIGWKDDEGNTIPSGKVIRDCRGAGFDPAL